MKKNTETKGHNFIHEVPKKDPHELESSFIKKK